MWAAGTFNPPVPQPAVFVLLGRWLKHMIYKTVPAKHSFNTLRPRQDGRHFADDIFMCIFFNENCCILIKFSLKYVRKGPIDNNTALVEIMAWRRSGDKPLSQPMMISLPTHICVTRPQWVKNQLPILKLYPKSHCRWPKKDRAVGIDNMCLCTEIRGIRRGRFWARELAETGNDEKIPHHSSLPSV